jgi:hypothetical protein
MNSNLLVSKDVSLNANLAVAGDVSLNSNLFVYNDVSFNNNLGVGGDISLNGSINVGKDVTIRGTLSVQQYSNINIINTTTTNYALILAEDLSVNGFMTVSDDVSLNSKLIVAGDVSLNNRLFVSNDVSINGILSVSKNLFFGTLPITKYYTWSSPDSSAVSGTPALTIKFNNPSFFAKINIFLSAADNVNDVATAFIEIKGGTTDGSARSSPMSLITAMYTESNSTGTNVFNCDVNNINLSVGGDNSTIRIPTANASSAGLFAAVRAEVVQTNVIANGEPGVVSISFSN